MADLHTFINYTVGLAPVVVSDNTAQNSAIIDCQNAYEVEFVILTGTLADADATFAVTMSHGDAANLSDAATVPDRCLLGTTAAASFTFADDGAIKKIGYVTGEKRYVRLTITPSANAASAPLAVLVVRRLRHL